MTPHQVQLALDEQRYETARRMCLASLADSPDSPQELLLLLHTALRALGDIPTARATLEKIAPRTPDERLDVALRLAEDFHKLASHDFYRTSAEKAQGLSPDEYEAKYEALSADAFLTAIALATTPAQQAQAAAALRRCKRQAQADTLSPAPPPTVPQLPAPQGLGTITGRLTFPDGTPVADATVTLGFPQAITYNTPQNHLTGGIGGGMKATFHGDQQTRTTRTNAHGHYTFADLPGQTYPFLAVNLDPFQHDLALRFFAHDITVTHAQTTTADAALHDWQSAPPIPLPDSLPTTFTHAGTTYTKLATHPLRNPFVFDFPRQFVTLPLPATSTPDQLIIVTSDAPDQPQPAQALDATTLGCFLALPESTHRTLAIYQADAPLTPATPLKLTPQADHTLHLDTGTATFRLPGPTAPLATPPILAVRGADHTWRGQGRWTLPAGITITSQQTQTLQAGPLQLSLAITYQLSTGDTLRFQLTAHANEPYLLVRETTAPIPGVSFDFSLREFTNGRGFLHWTPEHGNVHWTTLTPTHRELARLQESVAWWLPPQGFAYAISPDSLDQQDYIGVFTRRRGEWIDRQFERLAQGPGDDHRELDWPFPEMVGSTISMITAHTDPSGDAFFRFGAFDGERQWGLLVSTLADNDGPHKAISLTQHKVSSPRLQDLITWRLHDADTVQRPHLLAHRHDLCALRHKKESPTFAPIWQKLVNGHTRGPARGLRAILDADPILTWRLATEMRIEAPLRARMTLLGRDYADVYSPVGGRGITPFAEQYDLIAATGVFSPDHERDIRASLLLMGHMYMQEDFMNWRFNSRNANFEADRTDIVGTVGLAFRGNPDADAMVQHAADLMERSLNVYCTPGSGKWFENPACYYIHAASCRLNLAFHLFRHNILDSTAIPRLRDFMHWGPVLLTAPFPHDYATLRDGCDYHTYNQAEKVRRVPPIGDHAKLGQWVSEFFALMAKAYRQRDPQFADFLTWAYQQGGSNGGHFSTFPLYFTAVEDSDLQPAPPQTLVSRRLEGFGAVMRGNFGLPDEFYLLFKQGPGGYRYHRTEGSFLLMAHGRPLVWDGGEAGETWRHSTLSFHDTHMPLAPGHVTHFHTSDTLDFVQGVHPKALDPSDPIFLSDSCEHTLVDLAWQRYNEPNPAVTRAILWVKNDYLVIVDHLRLPAPIPTHWHLQVVSDAHTGDPASGYHFTGRYGVDLQVLLPDFPHSDLQATIDQVPTLEYNIPPDQCFSMRHLQLSMTTPITQLTAVLRPLAPGQAPLTATPFPGGIHVQGPGIDDTLFLNRDPITHTTKDIQFTGQNATILRRPHATTLTLLNGTLLKAENQTKTNLQ